MGLTTEKLDLFCEKNMILFTKSINHVYDIQTFKEWENKCIQSENGHEGFGALSHISSLCKDLQVDLNKLHIEVISEINHGLLSATNEFELKNYFMYINDKLDKTLDDLESFHENLNKVNFDATDKGFQDLTLQQRAIYLAFHDYYFNLHSCINFYKKIKSHISNQEILYIRKGESTGIEFSDILTHKILLLYDLGIINLLQNEYFNKTPKTGTDLATLIAHLIDKPDQVDTIRKAISAIELKVGKHKIQTRPAIKKVKIFLLNFGIDLKRLKYID